MLFNIHSLHPTGPAPLEAGRSKRLSLRSKDRRGFPTGFTLVELIIAMAVFSFVMVIVSVGVLQIMRIYQSNLTTRRTQQAARIVVDDITREIRSASNIEIAQADRLCLRGASIVEYQRQMVNANAEVLYKRIRKNDCNGSVLEERQLAGSSTAAGSDVQVRQFDVSPIGSSPTDIDSAKVVIGITTGLTTGLVCQPGPGSQFCAAASYSIVVTPRRGEQ